jgi:hypothetical protein
VFSFIDIKDNFILCRDCQSQKTLQQVMAQFPDTTAILGDHAVLWDFDIGIALYTLPLNFLRNIMLFDQTDCENQDITKIFNFMINKKNDHRYLTLRLIEYFNLTDYIYTYSGSSKNINDTRIFADIYQFDPQRKMFPVDVMMQILGDVTVAPRFLGINGYLGDAVQNGSVRYPGNYESWKCGLSEIFNTSLISLVTESDNGDHDQVTVFTEKTVYAVMGMTIPVWPGGYKHADMFESMGFDVFADIIDHSYQHESTMFMRCWRAFEDNLAVLQDLSAAEQISRDIMPRLMRNRERLFSPALLDWYRDQMQTWPPNIKSEVYNQFKLLKLC